MLQPKKIMVKVKKKIPVERLREVADSLQDVSESKWNKADGFGKSDADMRKSANKDMDNAERYRKLADKADKKSK
jgi:hypothetical protein